MKNGKNQKTSLARNYFFQSKKTLLKRFKARYSFLTIFFSKIKKLKKKDNQFSHPSFEKRKEKPI
jgi:hypothetical protein